MKNWYVHCVRCKEVVGVWSPEVVRDSDEDNLAPLLRCPGKGKHAPKEEEVLDTKFFGNVERVMISYPETRTYEVVYRYVGPPSLWRLAFAFLFAVKQREHEYFKRIRVQGKTLLWMPRERTFWKNLRKLIVDLRGLSK